MKLETLPFPVDLSLTLESSDYRWEMDVIRDETGKIVDREVIEKKVKEEGYKLGQPWGNNSDVAPYGLYKPIQQKNL
jgi:hypothetical protein